jgi:hypothetical protein
VRSSSFPPTLTPPVLGLAMAPSKGGGGGGSTLLGFAKKVSSHVGRTKFGGAGIFGFLVDGVGEDVREARRRLAAGGGGVEGTEVLVVFGAEVLAGSAGEGVLGLDERKGVLAPELALSFFVPIAIEPPAPPTSLTSPLRPPLSLSSTTSRSITSTLFSSRLT